MTRALALVVAVALLAAQKGDAVPSVRASVCLNKECSRSSRQGFEPATIRVRYSVPAHAENWAVVFGMHCSSGAEYESRRTLDGAQETFVAWIITYEEQTAGTCIAGADVYRRGSEKPINAKSETIRILATND